MELRTRIYRADALVRPVLPCPQCGRTLFAPEWSEYRDERRVIHLWSCTACDYEFEALVVYPPPGDPSV